MQDNLDVIQGSSPEQVADSEVVKTPASEPVKTEEKVVPYERFKEVNDKFRQVNTELNVLKNQPVKEVNKSLNVEDYIDISASLEGLDARQKEYLAREHKLTGRPLREIREGEDFKLWDSGYQAKVEKEKALKPSGNQPDFEKPMSFAEKLRAASPADREKLLTEAGLYKTPRPRADRTQIGGR